MKVMPANILEGVDMIVGDDKKRGGAPVNFSGGHEFTILPVGEAELPTI